MRIVRPPPPGPSPSLAIFYLVGSDMDARLREILPADVGIVAFLEAHGQPPPIVLQRLGLSRVGSLVLAGYSAGCQSVRLALCPDRLDALVGRVAVCAFDGSHASIPPASWQIDAWKRQAELAREGRRLFLATCTMNTYTKRLQKNPFMPTVDVLRLATGARLEPSAARPVDDHHEGSLHLYAYDSAETDAIAHGRQLTRAMPELLARHVVPWLAEGGVALMRPPPAPEGAGPALPSKGLGERAAEVALSLVGQKEQGGPNRGEIVRRSLAGCVRLVKDVERALGIREGVAWCAGFVGLCDHEARLAMLREGIAQFAIPAWRAAVRELHDDARRDKTWREVGAYVPLPGDLSVFRRGGKDPKRGEEGHVERVVSVSEDGTIESVGGNVGDVVVRHRWKPEDRPEGEELVGWIVRSAPAAAPSKKLTAAEREQASDAAALSLDKTARGLG